MASKKCSWNNRLTTEDDGSRTISCSCGGKIKNAESWENHCPKCQQRYNGSGQALISAEAEYLERMGYDQ